MIKHCFLIYFLAFLSACASLPQGKRYTIPFQHFGINQEKAAKSKSVYTLQPNDVVDVLFHFETIQTDVYRISPHDRLNVKFLTVPAYDDIYQVKPDGYVSLPLLGEFEAKGQTVEELRQNLTKAYANILKRPAFFVSLAEYQVHLKEVRQSLDHPSLGQARLVTVRDDYKVTMPLIGELSVFGKSIEEIAGEANAAYEKKISGMSVDILLHASQPREIFVFGEVKKPGNYRVSEAVSIFTAIALAGGPNDQANLETVLTLTKEGNEMAARVYNFNELLTGKSEATILNPNDILYVPRTALSSMAQTMGYISDILLFRGIDLGFSYKLN